jgi:hypothetical protein
VIRFVCHDPGRSDCDVSEVFGSSLLRSRPRGSGLTSGFVDLDLPGFLFDATLVSLTHYNPGIRICHHSFSASPLQNAMSQAS